MEKKFPRGDAFVEEHTGSATQINLDGQSDYKDRDEEGTSQVEDKNDRC